MEIETETMWKYVDLLAAGGREISWASSRLVSDGGLEHLPRYVARTLASAVFWPSIDQKFLDGLVTCCQLIGLPTW